MQTCGVDRVSRLRVPISMPVELKTAAVNAMSRQLSRSVLLKHIDETMDAIHGLSPPFGRRRIPSEMVSRRFPSATDLAAL